MFSRLGSHQCPNGHRLAPTIDVAAGLELTCPVCGIVFDPPGAEDLAFNSEGACPTCSGTGTVRDIDDDSLVPDPSKTIADGAVAPWGMFGLALMPRVVAEMGVRTDVPYYDLTEAEREVILDGSEEKRQILAPSKSGKLFDLSVTYRNARQAVREAMQNATSEKGLARVSRFITTHTCPTCHGTRLSEKVRSTKLAGIDLAQASALTLDEAVAWVPTVIEELPSDMHPMARVIASQFAEMARRLVQLGLGYLTLDRASTSLSTGERQRVQLARAVRNETTGVLYVLDEPSVGLHPANLDGLIGVMRDLLDGGNSVVMVDHDVQMLREADWMIEIGPGSGTEGGTILAQGDLPTVTADPSSLIGPFLMGAENPIVRERASAENVFERGDLHLVTSSIHTVHALDVKIPQGRLTAVTGMSGSGKTTLVLDSLIPALHSLHSDEPLPDHVVSLDTAGITHANVVDATPIGVNVRSTIATYSGILDDLRRAYAATDTATQAQLSAADFSYNTGSLRCPRCEGTGQVVLDVQFLPDVDIACPDCHGTRYAPNADQYLLETTDGPRSLPALFAMTVRQAHGALGGRTKIQKKLQTLIDLGLGYLNLSENTPALSGGEAQRLKLAGELSRDQSNTLFVLDEPSVGLHPLDTRVLIGVLDRLLAKGATIIVIEHDLDLIANADHIIDLGPGGGAAGGRIVATGTPEQVAANNSSITGRYLRSLLQIDAS
ncbi:excinuclease ABC subunit UvrA [Corynebacterium testudinoris]|uniref:UvrABC system protein A n=1 Tax=Corynebacterium testudinoris TaxID=136857 RepID=A0A0G3H8J7_9CORY|nr:excinuclease ABC subunit UvrA [Corynebacterium testudinoris]AKK07492.1 Excinuclease ATPase subunit [Corynebacterium testudinoris]